MKLLTPQALTSLLAFLTITDAQTVRLYDGGNSCDATATNLAVYTVIDSSCQIIGAPDADNCAGFTDGGLNDDSNLCQFPFEPTSANVVSGDGSSGTCTLYTDTSCPADGVTMTIPVGCSTIPTGYQAFICNGFN